jgi:hypothetical protein
VSPLGLRSLPFPMDWRYSLRCSMMHFAGKHDSHCIRHAERARHAAKGNRQTDCLAFRQFGLTRLYMRLARNLSSHRTVTSESYAAWVLLPDKWQPIDQNAESLQRVSFLITWCTNPLLDVQDITKQDVQDITKHTHRCAQRLAVRNSRCIETTQTATDSLCRGRSK